MDYMNKLSSLNLKAKPIMKIAGLALLGVVFIYFAFAFVGLLFSMLPPLQRSQTNQNYSDYSPSYSGSGTSEVSMSKSFGGGAPSLSLRNVLPQSSESDYSRTAGNSAENFEATDYRVSFQTRQLKNTCAAITGLKARQDVIFENASESNKYCNYNFKVERVAAGEILDILKGLKPKELTQSTDTLQGQVQDYTSEIGILRTKLASIDDTLSKAVSAYDEVSVLATKEKDVESLAKIINSKISTIQQLTQQRIDISSQLDQIQRTKDLQIDKINYTYFSVTIADNSFVDWQNIKDSWSSALKYSLANINQTIQNLTINLISLLFTLLQYAIYGLILLFVIKYGWKLTKYIWLQ